MLRSVTAILSDFARDGWARVGPLGDEATLAALRERADDIMLGRIVYPGLFFQRDATTGRYDDLVYGAGWEGPTLEYRKIEKLELDPLFRAWLTQPAFETIARALIPGAITVYRAVLFSKPAETGGTPLPWHQDGGLFWGVDRPPILQIWTALDDCPSAAGCVEVLPGSHAVGLATPHGGVVPKELVAAADAEPRALPLPARAGEVFLIHNHVWHRSGINRTGQPRRAFTVCYMSAETRCLRRRRAPRTFFEAFPEVA